jgi:hypothetical protein
VKQFTWFGVGNQIRLRYAADGMEEAMKLSERTQQLPSSIRMKSIHDSPGWWQALVSLPPEKRGRTLFVMLSTDGFNPFGKEVQLSLWPMLLRVLNSGPETVADTDGLILAGAFEIFHLNCNVVDDHSLHVCRHDTRSELAQELQYLLVSARG